MMLYIQSGDCVFHSDASLWIIGFIILQYKYLLWIYCTVPINQSHLLIIVYLSLVLLLVHHLVYNKFFDNLFVFYAQEWCLWRDVLLFLSLSFSKQIIHSSLSSTMWPTILHCSLVVLLDINIWSNRNVINKYHLHK